MSVTDLEKSMAHYRKLFGQEVSREKNPQRVWFKLAGTKLALEVVAPGQKPGFSHYCVKVAGFDRTSVTARLAKLGVKGETGAEKATLRFRDLYSLPVELVAG